MATIKWWMAQSSEARAELVADFALPTSLALMQLNQFIAANQFPAGRKYLRVWGNGAAFDNVILRAAYARAGAEVPWDWWHDLDVRTVVEMGRVLGYDPNAVTPLQARAITRLMTPCFRPSTYQNSGSA
jgi:hypothetical protein